MDREKNKMNCENLNENDEHQKERKKNTRYCRLRLFDRTPLLEGVIRVINIV
jgi:hypothetical protein